VRVGLKLAAMLLAAVLIGVALRFVLLPGETGHAGKAAEQQSGGRAGKAGDVAKKGAAPAGPVPVLAAAAKAEDVPIIIRSIGTVAAFNAVAVKSRVDGYITKILYREGEQVRTGQALIQIDPRPYQAVLDQAAANQGKDEATLEDARRNLARYAALVQTQLAVTRQQYDTQKALVAQLEATVKSDAAAVEAAKLNVDYTTIHSPIDGVVGLQLVAVGNLVQAGSADPLVQIEQVRPIGVTFTLPERDLDRVRQAAAQTKLAVLAYDGDDSRELAQGTLSVINNQVDQATGTITLKAIFPNKNAALWPGQFVNAHLVLRTVKNGVTVAPGAVQMGPGGPFVYVIKPDWTVEARPIEVVQVENDKALIGKGLAAGERIVVSGQTGLSPGIQVAVRQGAPGESNAKEPEIGPEGVGSTGTNTAPAGAGGINPR
jgi:membrane fusion protein, multidrug efflux system